MSVPRKGERTRAKIEEAAGELFRRRGYHGTGIGDILAHSGAPRGSLYFHFPGGKEEIACAAIRASGSRWRAALGAVLNAAPDQAAAITGVCEFLAGELESSDYALGCPAATVALECADESDSIRAACAALYADWQNLVAQRIAASGVDAETSASQAAFVISAIEGALLIGRVERSTRAIRAVASALTSLLPPKTV